MSGSADLIARLRAAGDPLDLLAAEALVASVAEVEKLRAREFETVTCIKGDRC